MKCKRQSYQLFAWIQLLLFLFPYIGKTAHSLSLPNCEHSIEHECETHDIQVHAQQANNCLICHYELLSFTQESNIYFSAFAFHHAVFNTTNTQNKQQFIPRLFNLRAPPYLS